VDCIFHSARQLFDFRCVPRSQLYDFLQNFVYSSFRNASQSHYFTFGSNSRVPSKFGLDAIVRTAYQLSIGVGPLRSFALRTPVNFTFSLTLKENQLCDLEKFIPTRLAARIAR